MKLLSYFLFSLVLIIEYSCTSTIDIPESVQTYKGAIKFKPDYNIHIKPILSDRCFLCHGTDINSRKAELDLSDRSKAIAPLPLNKSKRAITPGHPAKSELVARILSQDDTWKMPPLESHRLLSDEEKALIIKWIEDGAEYKPHWSFISPVKTKPPSVKDKSWIKNDIDAFILNQLETKGWKPNSEADRATLIRRVSMDLTGLPPTIKEIEAFENDPSPNAYEKLVDRLLATSDYGENMAVYWMDLARFADTHGYTVDRYRPAWPWRDWVIKAFNENMPYDQFVTWQLAGDLFPHVTRDQKLATAFNRIHAQNMEGGIVNEEFRVEYVMDRTNTFGTAFLGLTIECARCHDHKFDPFTQKNYYQLFSYFNNIEEAGQISWDNATPVPTMLLSTTAQDSVLSFIEESIQNKTAAIERFKEDKLPSFKEWESLRRDEEKVDINFGLVNHYSFDNYDKKGFKDLINKKESAVYKEPKLVNGISGKAFETNGDDILSFGTAGLYDRSHAFTISAWIKIPPALQQGVILFKGFGEVLYNYRGYFLNLRGSQLELTMNHTWPYNSIIKITTDTIQRDTWMHVAITYDGSSKASGLNVYMNGIKTKTITEKDNLTKSILLNNNGLPSKQPGLGFGADFRSAGIQGGAIDELRVYDYNVSDPIIQMIYDNDLGKKENNSNFDWSLYYFQHKEPNYKKLVHGLESLFVQRNAFIDTIPEMMVMDEMDSPKPAYVLNRGVYSEPKERVYPRAPAQILDNRDTGIQNRLSLAQWLFDLKHPLTARVLVNRYWQHYFGKGLVATSENFGFQGGLPSHPELLDWLAIYMLENKWDIKAMQKYILLSATYRQSSLADEHDLQRDPENKWLSRGPSRALSAENIRDHALASSGLLSKKIGGPSVKPYQPDGLWALSGQKYVQDTGQDLYRKSLYSFWMRTNPPPTMSIFDAPSRSFCTVKRQQTSTPLQSLVLLNDPQIVEASRSLAYHALQTYKDAKSQIKYIYKTLTALEPTEKELEILTNLFDREYELMKKNPNRKKGWLSIGNKKFKEDEALLASGTILANTIMNSDAYTRLR